MSTPEAPPPIPPGDAGRASPAIDRLMLYITWLVPVLEQFPRSQRFLLGDRLQGLALDLLEALVEAQYRKAPRGELQRANLLLEKQRLLWRVAYNLRHADVRRYEHAAREIDEIGRRIGAWLKKLGPAAHRDAQSTT